MCKWCGERAFFVCGVYALNLSVVRAILTLNESVE